MTRTPPDGFEWPAGWEPIVEEGACLEYPHILAEVFGGDPPANSLVDELQREVSPAHPLYRVSCFAVARCRDYPNEFLFLTANPRMPLAFVHLTWNKEKGENFPCVVGYESWDAYWAAWIDVSAG